MTLWCRLFHFLYWRQIGFTKLKSPVMNYICTEKDYWEGWYCERCKAAYLYKVKKEE